MLFELSDQSTWPFSSWESFDNSQLRCQMALKKLIPASGLLAMPDSVEYLLVARCRVAACPLEFCHIYTSWIAWVDLVIVINCCFYFFVGTACNCQSEVRPLQNWSRPWSGSCSSKGQAGCCCIVVLGKVKTVIGIHCTLSSASILTLWIIFLTVI